MTADDEPQRAAIYLSLHRGENYPALDMQPEETLRETERTGRVLHAVYCDVAGALNPRLFPAVQPRRDRRWRG